MEPRRGQDSDTERMSLALLRASAKRQVAAGVYAKGYRYRQSVGSDFDGIPPCPELWGKECLFSAEIMGWCGHHPRLRWLYAVAAPVATHANPLNYNG
jgi:hypothetical protein